MAQGVLGRHGVERAERQRAERAAGCGEHEARDLVPALAAQQLVEGVMLAVDRQQAHAPSARAGRDGPAGEDEDLLARQGDVLARLDGREGGLQPRGADDGGDDGAHLGEAGGLGQPLRSPEDAGAGGELAGGAGGERGRRVPQGDDADMELARGPDQRFPSAAGGEAGDAQSRGMGPGHREGGGADGAGGPEDGDGPGFHAREAW